jgi:hypothetical protein
MPASLRHEIRFTPEQEARRREFNKISWQVLLAHLPILGVAFYIDLLAGSIAAFITFVNMGLLPLHIQRCREENVTWWKRFPAAAFFMNALVLILFSMASYHLYTEQQMITFEHATLETYMSGKMAMSCDKGDCPSVSAYEGMDWMYMYRTRVNGKVCNRIIVHDVEHRCPDGMKNVTAAEWQRLRVGQVLKVVELK